MEIKKHYCEVMDIVDKLFVTMFDSLNASCKKELEAIGRQYPFEPLKYLRKTLWLTFQEDVQMFKVLEALHFMMLLVVEVCSVVRQFMFCRRTALSNSA
ncbi:aspartate--tRNA ligase 2, cytoplasmic-like isoform X2 [Syzygium oleosum]|uniref:aspartate--tRNA ligase 2, cytoplasmic-like isoform X2 n=1 Tax=Syzygium oleosum TaxID=219896 RepID=UPI0024B94AE6|nr:aspartate--tRNA ligase 2, cytoplasmic-like isoform X2 [Syzygium oleosum]